MIEPLEKVLFHVIATFLLQASSEGKQVIQRFSNSLLFTISCQLRVFMHYLPEMEFCHFSGSASCFAPSLFFSALQFFEGVVPFCSRYKMFFELLKFLVIHQIHAKLFHAHEKHVTLIRNMDKSSFSKLSSFCDC